MYSGDLSPRDRAGPIVAVVAVHVGLAFMLLGMAGHLTPAALQDSLKTFDVREVPPHELQPPQPPKPKPRPTPAAAKPKAAAPPAKKA